MPASKRLRRFTAATTPRWKHVTLPSRASAGCSSPADLMLTAVSSDLVASAIMKPVGSFVHLRRGTVHLGLVKWLCIGSVPGAFGGVLIARALGRGQEVQDVI